MTDNPRVQQLLEQLQDSNATPEEVCASCPELLPVVRQRWRRMCRVLADLNALFPLSDAPTLQPPGGPALPQIPGYEVEAVLGRGGMGVVFRARHLRLNRLVALKMALAGWYADPRERARFQREAEAVARLRHPNVVQVYDVGEADGRPYFTMELVEGGSLAQKLAGTPLPAHQAAQLVATLAGAMQAAHECCGLVHRDLKPGNVLLTAYGTPKISDFGVARRVGDGAGLTQTGAAVGTPSYMAPEQARGGPDALGPAADVYALGAILYELLTGRPPFRAETAAATLQQVLDEEPVPPARRNPWVPRDLETICLKCLQKKPGQRYPTAADLAADLERFLRHEPIQARPPGWLERCLLWVRRRPTTAGLLFAVLLLVAAGAVGGWSLYAARVRQARTDQEVRGVVARARGLLEEGWRAADLAKLAEARAEGNRAVDIARSGGASAAVQQGAEALQQDAVGRGERAEKNRALREALLEVSSPPETKPYLRDKSGRVLLLPLPSVDRQYVATFRNWGLDVDGTAEAEVVRRLGGEPEPVVQEVIAALDHWMIVRRQRGRPEAEWGRLYRVADQLDRSERHRQLRALLLKDPPRRGADVEALERWQRDCESVRRGLRKVRAEINPRTAPPLTVLLLARVLAAIGDAAEAEKVLREAVTARPDQVVLLSALARLLEQQGPSRFADAIGYFRAARSQRPQLGLSLIEVLVRAGRPAEVEELTREMLHRQPDHPAVSFYLGVALFHQRKYGAAEAAYRKVIKLMPDVAEAHLNLGCALGEQRKYGAAAAAFRRAIELKPGLAAAHHDLGNVLFQQRQHGKAEAAYRKAIDLKPDYVEAHYNLGVSLAEQGQLRPAEAAFRAAIALDPRLPEPHNGLGQVLLEQRQRGEAEAAIRKALALKPDLAAAQFNLGDVLSQQGRHAEAEAAYRKAIAATPDYPAAYNNLGSALLAQGKYDAAVAAYRKAIAVKPDILQGHCGLGLALLGRKDYGPAEAAFRKALFLKPDLDLAWYFLASALQHQARFDEAAATFQKAGALFPAQHPRREEARRLQQLCQRYATLDARLPAVLKGTEKPADAAEQVEFAKVCALKRFNVAAARLYADAFARKPELAEDLRTGIRYEAACSAALVGCGRGEDKAEVSDAERARWRAQARQWLRADLDAWGRELKSAFVLNRSWVHNKLARWRRDPDLAGLRDSDALEKLPPAERQESRTLWGDLDALLERARPSQ
jgi:serine/threonine-protein kinase